MIYGNESIQWYTPRNMAIWMVMAFQAGVLNIGGFMACHRFVSHVTGFATFFGVEISAGEGFEAFGMLTVPLFFLMGAMLSGHLVDLRLRQHKRPRYYITFGLIFLLTFTVFGGGMLGWFGAFGEPLALARDYFLLALLCLACGIQNGTIATVSGFAVRTTHLTGLTTDLGIGIVRLMNRERLPDLDAKLETKANFMRTAILIGFVAGSVVGGFAFARYGYGGFALPSLTSGGLFALMIFFQVVRPKVQESERS